MLGEANEAVFSPPRKYLTQAHFAVDVNLRMIMNLGRKVGNRSSIQSEKLFFFLEITTIWEKIAKSIEITMISGEKREIRDQSHIF